MKEEMKEKIKRTEWFEQKRIMMLKSYINKPKWGIYTDEGELIEVFRTKRAANESVHVLNKTGLGVRYIIVTIL